MTPLLMEWGAREVLDFELEYYFRDPASVLESLFAEGGRP
jgi:hypothetical protein